MSSSSDDTILPPQRRPINAGGLDGDTVLPSQNVIGIHAPGDVIDGRYTVIREIGRGGMGVVYEVEDDLVGIRVAVKRLLPELAQRADLIEVFKREGRNAIRFTAESPRFVTIRHLGTDTSGLYLVMDFVEDTTLRAMLEGETEHRLRVSTATRILVELASALIDLHRLGFVHRDVKPENIFVQRVGGDQVRVRLVDFGLTKDDAEGTRTSIRGAGTSGYASPEQRKGLPTTPATDVYSFGVIAYEILTGELPSMGDSITDFVSDVPQNLVDIIVRCQASRPERRPQDGAELARLLGEQLTSASDAISDVAVNLPQPVQPPVVHVGILILSGVPDGASITLDGVAVSGLMHKVTLNDESQPVELLIKCNGYVDCQRKVMLASDMVTEHNVLMTRVVVKPTTRLAEFPHLDRYVHNMSQIPAGKFEMGRALGREDESPVHTVTLSYFSLGATPVTVDVWKEYCRDSWGRLPEAPDWGLIDDHPIVNVSWNDIMGADEKGGFCAWASDIAGFRLSLPTEAQYEFASLGGNDVTLFPWGNSFIDENLWCSKTTYRGRTASVHRSSHVYRNNYGLIDMSGNVFQWCFDHFGSYSSTNKYDPLGPPVGIYRSIRGSSWRNTKNEAFTCSARMRSSPEGRNGNLGFRLAST